MTPDTGDSEQVLVALEQTIQELDEPYRHLVQLRLHRIRAAFADTDAGRVVDSGDGADDPVRRFRAARREAVLRAHISTLVTDVSLLVAEPGAGEQARRVRDLLRNLGTTAAQDRPDALDAAVVANPVIDDEWYAKEIAALRVALGAEFPGLTPATIVAALDLATTRVAARARIPNYLPVLVARDARDWLSAQLDESGPST